MKQSGTDVHSYSLKSINISTCTLRDVITSTQGLRETQETFSRCISSVQQSGTAVHSYCSKPIDISTCNLRDVMTSTPDVKKKTQSTAQVSDLTALRLSVLPSITQYYLVLPESRKNIYLPNWNQRTFSIPLS